MKESEKKDKGKVRKTAQLFSLDKEEKPSSWRTGKYLKVTCGSNKRDSRSRLCMKYHA